MDNIGSITKGVLCFVAGFAVGAIVCNRNDIINLFSVGDNQEFRSDLDDASLKHPDSE